MGFAPQRWDSKDWATRFQPSQIVCLEHEVSRLYAEVVQMVEARGLCWARPLVLVTDLPKSQFLGVEEENSPWLSDLRQGSDLLLPAVLFRQALDTEVIPLLSTLYSLDAEAESRTKATILSHQQLNQFIRQVCQAHPEAFSN
jgi:hypothetical protein